MQTAEIGVAQHDYIVTMPDGVVSLAFGEPEWAAAYWAMKSDMAAPGIPSLRLEVQQDNRRTRPTPFTGGTANGGAYTPDVRNPVDAFESEVTLRLLGVQLGNWINGAPMAGETFGWGPAGSGAIVFVGSRRTAHADGSAGATEGCRHDQGRVDAGVVERRHAARVPAEGRKETLPAHDRGSRACYDLEFMDFRPTEEQELLRRTRARVRRNRNPPARPRMG